MRVFLRRKHRAYVALREWYRWLSTQPFTTWPDSQERYSARVGKFGMDPVKWAVEEYRRKHSLNQIKSPTYPLMRTRVGLVATRNSGAPE